MFFQYRIGRNLILFSSCWPAPAGPAEQYFQLCCNIMELDKSIKQVGCRQVRGRKAGGQAVLSVILLLLTAIAVILLLLLEAIAVFSNAVVMG